jgi:hypothetical protein
MNTTKRFFFAIWAMIFFALGALGQTYTVNTLTLTNTVAGSTTITPNVAIPLAGRYDQLSLQATFVLASSGTSGVNFTIQRSLDNTNWETVPYQTLTVTGAGTSSVTGILDFTYGAAGYLRLASIVNSNSVAVNSLVIKTATKPRPYNK